MSKISVAEVRRRLPVGTEVVVTYTDGPQVVRGNVGNAVLSTPPPVHRRIIEQTTTQMISADLAGPRKDHRVHCRWAGMTARDDNGAIFLSHKAYLGRDAENNDILGMKEFVKFEVK